jgi:hypothetical protein
VPIQSEAKSLRRAYWTTTVPFMFEWIVQWYANVPAWEKVALFVAPPATLPQSGPASNETVWANESLFVQVTVDPFDTVVEVGSYAVLWMDTAVPPVPVHATAAAPPPPPVDAAGGRALPVAGLPPPCGLPPLGVPPPHAANMSAAAAMVRNCKKRTALSSSAKTTNSFLSGEHKARPISR